LGLEEHDGASGATPPRHTCAAIFARIASTIERSGWPLFRRWRGRQGRRP